MKGGKRFFWYFLLAVAAAVVIEYVGYQYQGPTVSPQATPTATASAPSSKAPAKATPQPASQPANYGVAVGQYQGRRIQFDMYCHANPSTQTFPNGTSIMLDNRSGDARIITVGGVQYSLAGYGWKIVTLSTKSIPTTLSLGCGSAVNVGTILLQ